MVARCLRRAPIVAPSMVGARPYPRLQSASQAAFRPSLFTSTAAFHAVAMAVDRTDVYAFTQFRLAKVSPAGSLQACVTLCESRVCASPSVTMGQSASDRGSSASGGAAASAPSRVLRFGVASGDAAATSRPRRTSVSGSGEGGGLLKGYHPVSTVNQANASVLGLFVDHTRTRALPQGQVLVASGRWLDVYNAESGTCFAIAWIRAMVTCAHL